MSKQKICTILLLLSSCNYTVGTESQLDGHVTNESIHFTEGVSTPSALAAPAKDLDLEEPKNPISKQATTTIPAYIPPQPQILLEYTDSHTPSPEEIMSTRQFFLDRYDLFNELLDKKHKDYYWQNKMDQLKKIMQDNSADITENDIEEIRLNAPEIYERYRRQFEEYMSKRARDKPALLRKSHFILDVGELARGEKSKPVEKKQEEKKEESKLPPPGRRILDHAFEVIIIGRDQTDYVSTKDHMSEIVGEILRKAYPEDARKKEEEERIAKEKRRAANAEERKLREFIKARYSHIFNVEELYDELIDD